MKNEMKYYVALDLGSDSMAAYFEQKDMAKGEMVDLQAYGRQLLGRAPELILESGTPSPRLRTRIALEHNRQPADLSTEHAKLDFVDGTGSRLPGYDQSLLSYFYSSDEALGRSLIPNPKIPFQQGARRTIPQVDTTCGSGKVQHTPAKLLKHLIVQVLRNFVLRSPQLRDVAPPEIHLILTMPNVYSLVHVDELCRFVRKHVDVGEVDYVYESDAVAYIFIDAPKGTGTKAMEDFKELMIKRPRQDVLRIATLDIGRGTTDLSMVQIEDPPAGGNNKRHFVLARTGKTDGGNRLSYIFAQYYEDVISGVLAGHGRKPPFSLLYGEATLGSVQALALADLERLIEEIKCNIGEKYRLTITREEQQQWIEPLVARILKELDPGWREGVVDPGLEGLHVELLEALVLPEQLRRATLSWLVSMEGIKKTLSNTRSGGDVSTEHLRRVARLEREIEDYVTDNVVRLVERLREMVEIKEKRMDPGGHQPCGKKIFDRECTFVMIAGQASQFGPIRAKVRDRFGRYKMPAKNLHFLNRVEAKEACCRGAVHYHRARVQRANPNELHGSYGFLNAAPTSEADRFKAADMQKLANGGADTVSFMAETQAWLVYSSRPPIPEGEPPKLEDGATAVIRDFEGDRFRIMYDPERLRFEINDERVDALKTYGNADESVYPKIWPEVVMPASDSSLRASARKAVW